MISKHLPLVTVGIPTYNRSRTLPRAVKSVLNQTYKNIEMIISDNGSTDKTAEIGKTFAKTNNKIRYYRQSCNKGIVFNHSFVLRLAKGKYFKWLSDDDFLSPTYIENIIDLLETDSHAVLGVTNAVQFNSRTKYLLKLPFRHHEDSFNATKIFLINPHVVSPLLYGVYKTSVLRSAPVHTDSRPMYSGKSDIIFVLLVLLRGNLVYSSKSVTYIRDSAHYLDKFDLMKQHALTKEIIVSIKRYLCYPIMFMLDLIYSTKYILLSAHTFRHRCILIIMAIRRWVTEQVLFVYNIVKGGAIFVYGFLE